MLLSKKLENFNKCNVSLIYFFKKKQLQTCRWLLLQVLQEASSWHTAKSKISGNFSSLHGRVHPPGVIINTQGTVSTAKTQMKANCSWKHQQCCSISKRATSDSALPLRDLPRFYPKSAPLGPWAILFPSMPKATFCEPQWKPDLHMDRGVLRKQLLSRGRWLSDWLPFKITLGSLLLNQPKFRLSQLILDNYPKLILDKLFINAL